MESVCDILLADLSVDILQLLEVYALQIQMYTAQKDNKKLVSIYEKALRTKSGVAHPVSRSTTVVSVSVAAADVVLLCGCRKSSVSSTNVVARCT